MPNKAIHRMAARGTPDADSLRSLASVIADVLLKK